MGRKTPPPKEHRHPRSAGKPPAERLVKLPLGGAPALLPKGRPVPSVEYEIDPGYPRPLLPGAASVDDGDGKVPATRYFYVDSRRGCVSCGVEFVFTAEEQKHFFEKLLFPFYSAPVHCPRCRRERRGMNELKDALQTAREELAAAPAEPTALLAVAAAIVRLYEPTGQGDLKEVIACARKAARQASPSQLGEAAFWEAKAQLLAGRRQKAVPLFQLAFEKLPGNKRCAPLRAETAEFLAAEKEAARSG